MSQGYVGGSDGRAIACPAGEKTPIMMLAPVAAGAGCDCRAYSLRETVGIEAAMCCQARAQRTVSVAVIGLLILGGRGVPAKSDVFVLHSGGKVKGELLNPREYPRLRYEVRTRWGG